MEPLIQMPRSEWPSLMDLFESNWPRCAAAFCLLDSYNSQPDLIEIFHFKVYCPYGDISNGMIAISDEFEYYNVVIRPIDSIVQIEKALSSTKLINWNRQVVVPSASPDVEHCLYRVREQLGLRVDAHEKVFQHILRKHSKLYKNLSCPPDTFVAPLRPEHIKLIDDTWTYHGETTHSFFATLLKYDLTYVLYSSKDKSPVAWITVGPDGSLTHLYCLEPYKRQGYGEFITKFAANDQLQKEKNVLAYTLGHNEIAQNLFHKAGFDTLGFVKWIYVNKRE